MINKNYSKLQLKIGISIKFIDIKTGHVIYKESLEKFDMDDLKELKKAISSIYKTIKSIQKAQEEMEENGE